jgi:hypothetical protein
MLALEGSKGEGLAEVADRSGPAGVSIPLSKLSASRAPMTALLRGYWQVFVLLDSTPAVVWTRVGSGRFSRHLRLPRLRWFLRPMVSFHVSRSVAALKRAYYGTVVVEDQPEVDRDDIGLLEDFEHSLMPLGLRRVAIFIIVGGFLLAYGMANLIHANQTKFLGDFTRAVVELDRGAAIKAFHDLTVKKIAGAVVLILWSAWLIMLVPAMAFRLKRAAFNLMTSSPRELADSPAHIHASQSTGVYTLEREAFAPAGRVPPREVPLDLITRSVLIVSWLTVGVGGWFTSPSSDRWVSFIFIVPSLYAAYRTVRTLRRRASARSAAGRPGGGQDPHPHRGAGTTGSA